MPNLHSSLSILPSDTVTPEPFAAQHPNPQVGHYAGVRITDSFTVMAYDPEVLLEISTAFADAALRMQRLTGDLPAAVTA